MGRFITLCASMQVMYEYEIYRSVENNIFKTKLNNPPPLYNYVTWNLTFNLPVNHLKK